MSERKPLTLEQLLRMDGKPVFCISLKDGRKKWRVVQSIEKFVDVVKVICFTDCKDETVASYGKTWIAYAYEPPRLDRSAWEPCDDCKEISYWDEKCDNCKYDDFFAHQEPCASCESKSKWEPCYSFCPTCGRPLTDAAWEMLERRVEGIT